VLEYETARFLVDSDMYCSTEGNLELSLGTSAVEVLHGCKSRMVVSPVNMVKRAVVSRVRC
jgi:hypothetical protein